jgi:hypothetical protein
VAKKKPKKYIKSKVDTKGPGFRTSKSFKGSLFGKSNKSQVRTVPQKSFQTQHKG